MQGWTHPTLARQAGQWVIWSDRQTVFVAGQGHAGIAGSLSGGGGAERTE